MVKISDITPYVVPNTDIKTGDKIQIVKGISMRPKAETGFDRDTAEIIVKLPNGKEKPLTLNRTSQKALAAKYGDESDEWKNQYALVKIALQSVRGTMKDVIYLEPTDSPKKEKVK